MLTINIKKKVKSVDETYAIYLGFLETLTSLQLTNQEKIVMVELLKEKEITKELRDNLKTKVKRVDNILTLFRKKGLIKDNKIAPFFKEINGEVSFNVVITNG